MKIITKVTLCILSIIVLNIIVFNTIVTQSEDQIRMQIEQNFVASSQKSFKNFDLMEKRIARNVSSMLARDKGVIQGFLDNDRLAIIDKTQDVWNELSINDNMIYEIHYFKPLGNSFVNFYNLSKYGQDITAARDDVVTTFRKKKASEHFWICRLFPGIRSTYPIKGKKGKTIGVISVGIHFLRVVYLVCPYR